MFCTAGSDSLMQIKDFCVASRARDKPPSESLGSWNDLHGWKANSDNPVRSKNVHIYIYIYINLLLCLPHISSATPAWGDAVGKVFVVTLTKGKSCTLFGAYWLCSSELFTSVCIKPYTLLCFAARYYYQAMVCIVISPVSTSLHQPLNQKSWKELIQLI